MYNYICVILCIINLANKFMESEARYQEDDNDENEKYTMLHEQINLMGTAFQVLKFETQKTLTDQVKRIIAFMFFIK